MSDSEKGEVFADPKKVDANITLDEKPSSPVESGSSTTIDAAAEKRLLRRIDFHLIPILFLIYLLAFLDRVNIGNAKIQGMIKDLHMNPLGSDYNVTLMIFFVPYILLEVPSNIIMKKIRPSRWLGGLMFFWGISTMCMGLTTNFAGLVVCRVFLGIFEAGVFPGCAYLITMYYKRFELQKRLVLFFSSSMLAGAFGGLLAFALAKMDGLGNGVAGWRWIFIIEGIATIGVSIVAMFLIVDWPETAKFLSPEDRVLLNQRLAQDHGYDVARMDRLDKAAFFRIMKDWKIWCGVVMYMCITTTGYATNFFIPTILTEFGWVAADAQLHTIPIYVVGTVVTLTAAWLSDRLQHRFLFTIGGVLISAIGYIILLNQGTIGAADGLPSSVKYMALFFITSGGYITQPLCVVWLANNMGGHYKRAFATAMQIGLGNIGGIYGSSIFLAWESPKYPTGYGTGLALLLFCGVMCVVFYFGLMAENRVRERGGRDYRLRLEKRELENLGDDHPEFRFNG